MKLICKLTAVVTLVIGLVFMQAVSGEWSDDPTLRTPVSTAEYRQYHPRLVQVNDDFVVTWQDRRRYDTHVDVFAQKININGEMLWPENGRVIAAGPENSLIYHVQLNAGLVHDGDGGALIAWNDANDPYYLQAFVTKAASDATVNWGDPGESIQSGDTAVPMLANPTMGANRLHELWGMVADSEKGIFVPLGTGFGRFDSSGSLRTNWFHDSSDSRVAGLAVPMVPVLEADDNDAVIVFWNQGNTSFSEGIRARKLVDPEASWPVEPDTFSIPWGTLSVYTPDYNIGVCSVAAVPDGAGGAIAVWVDNRVQTDTGHYRVYAQKVDSDGNLMWGDDGIEVSDDVMTYTCYWWQKMFAADDGEGGVVIAWNDDQESIRAQRLNAEGIAQWTAGGVILDTEDGIYTNFTTHGLLRSDDGNFIVLYHDEEDELLITQKLDATQGSLMWGEGQIVLDGCFYPYNAGNAPMVSDGQAGAVVAWEGCDGNIYAHRVMGTEAATYSVSGMVSGLTGNGLELQNNGTDTLAISLAGPLTFTFATKLQEGSAYAVTVSAQPTGQTCGVINGSGTITAADVTNVTVVCENNPSPSFQINPGLNDAWYYKETDGQGFFITVFPDLGKVSLAWFTYDTDLPPEGATANLGDPGHRWITAAGPFVGDQAVMNVVLTSGGLFDTATEIQRTDPPGSDGTLTITFDGCNSGMVEYDIPTINRQGSVPIERIAHDNIVICEALIAD